MNLYDYADVQYRRASLLQQQNYSTLVDGRQKCATTLIHAQRVFYKWLYIPIFLIHYTLVKVRICKEPEVPELKKPQGIDSTAALIAKEEAKAV